MKITKRGKHCDDIIWVGKCDICDSEAEAKEGELIHRSLDDAFHECPVCHNGDNGTAKFGHGMYFVPKK